MRAIKLEKEGGKEKGEGKEGEEGEGREQRGGDRGPPSPSVQGPPRLVGCLGFEINPDLIHSLAT